uniref:3'(2'),5'-bisphosphate nucleotidase CysQ n=1 Tax=Candidatus Kentrum sp. LPFa TaxID=2126335 RepID=A0A450XF89_9GAMM|nr:MAG: 3'(2'),5'-bisphosphate nucleotidase [Candidatus Kentron sp. LPFa]VFK27955.1 MAG: 3'(2'),5'-bisphosphate nucleotidase [Candidatus Kentron sp. LPFa]
MTPIITPRITKLQRQSWLDATRRIARDAGDAILAIYTQDFSIYEKSDASPLTEADLAAHRVIVTGLGQLEPKLPILSEESTEIPFQERRQWNTYWLVDPLDGTREFIKRNGEFTVNIALIRDGQPILGVIHIPVWNRTYFAAKGLGAYRWEGSGQNTPRAATPIRVRAQIEKPLRILRSRSRSSQSLDEYLAKASAQFGRYEVVTAGSSLKFCLIAEGAADLYPQFGLTSEWDTAAAHAIILEAGGQITDMRLDPLIYNRKESLLNPTFFAFGHRHHDWSAFL